VDVAHADLSYGFAWKARCFSHWLQGSGAGVHSEIGSMQPKIGMPDGPHSRASGGSLGSFRRYRLSQIGGQSSDRISVITSLRRRHHVDLPVYPL